MASKSSFLPRLSLSRNDESLLPFYSPKIKNKQADAYANEYDLTELSPHPEDPLLFLSPRTPKQSFSPRQSFSPQSHSPTDRYSDMISNPGSASKPGMRSALKTPMRDVLFAGPPPPIATSKVLYRDEEAPGVAAPRGSKTVSFAQNTISTIHDEKKPGYEPDMMWRNLQRREKALQEHLQHLLDAQSVGLAANLDANPAPMHTSNSHSDTSDAGTSTPTGTLYTAPTSAEAEWRRQNLSGSSMAPRDTPLGSVIPVRQPKPKPIGLRAARTGLSHTMAQLADLKASEDAELAEALGARKRALLTARALVIQRNELTALLHTQQDSQNGDGGGDPLDRELRELHDEAISVSSEIAELEERLAALRSRKSFLESRYEDVRNRREAGLSGYRGALKEVEKRMSSLVRQPPVQPLDIEAIVGQGGRGDDKDEYADIFDLLKGSEFMRLRPDRRTIDMARELWDAEVTVLERRKKEVNMDRAALLQGIALWNQVGQLVTDFERAIWKAMRAESDIGPNTKGKDKQATPEEILYAQLDKMASIMDELQKYFNTAEEKGWNLLICAIGAELEAFKQGREILRETLRAAGLQVDDDNKQNGAPDLGGSASLKNTVTRLITVPEATTPLVDLVDEDPKQENGNDIPSDLLSTQAESNHGISTAPENGVMTNGGGSHEEHENEVPPEFLAEHHSELNSELEDSVE